MVFIPAMADILPFQHTFISKGLGGQQPQQAGLAHPVGTLNLHQIPARTAKEDVQNRVRSSRTQLRLFAWKQHGDVIVENEAACILTQDPGGVFSKMPIINRICGEDRASTKERLMPKDYHRPASRKKWPRAEQKAGRHRPPATHPSARPFRKGNKQLRLPGATRTRSSPRPDRHQAPPSWRRGCRGGAPDPGNVSSCWLSWIFCMAPSAACRRWPMPMAPVCNSIICLRRLSSCPCSASTLASDSLATTVPQDPVKGQHQCEQGQPQGCKFNHQTITLSVTGRRTGAIAPIRTFPSLLQGTNVFPLFVGGSLFEIHQDQQLAVTVADALDELGALLGAYRRGAVDLGRSPDRPPRPRCPP